VQDYLLAELKSYGCFVETDSFGADTPIGRLNMKNILVKIPGEKPGVILLGTHYDTLLMDNFVGADDAGSSTAVMLELARLLCPQKGKFAVWIAFFDGEEAMKRWSDTDSRYGSRQMAARFSPPATSKRSKHFCWRISSAAAKPVSCANPVPRRHWSISFGTQQPSWAIRRFF